MKCKDCGQSYVRLDECCVWSARCNILGSSFIIGPCAGLDNHCKNSCDDQEPPDWDCDLAQGSEYCKHAKTVKRRSKANEIHKTRY